MKLLELIAIEEESFEDNYRRNIIHEIARRRTITFEKLLEWGNEQTLTAILSELVDVGFCTIDEEKGVVTYNEKNGEQKK